MTVATNGYTLNTSTYTAIATSAVGRVRIIIDNNQLAVRLVVSPSTPDPSTDDYFPVQPGQILSLEGLGGFTVWALAVAHPSGAAFTQKVRVLKDAPLEAVVLKPLM